MMRAKNKPKLLILFYEKTTVEMKTDNNTMAMASNMTMLSKAST